MCGIVGLLVKKPELRATLGALMVPMLTGMTERGPDSAGLAVYTAPVSRLQHKLSLYSGSNNVDWSQLLGRISKEFAQQHEISVHGNQAVLSTSAEADSLVAWLKRHATDVAVLQPDGSTVRRGQQAVAPGDVVLVGLGERMEREGVGGAANHAGKREILVGPPPPL